MAFNAGAIESTLTLDRDPFTTGLRVARAQGRAFAKEKFEAAAGIKINDRDFNQLRARLRALSKDSRTALAKVVVDRLRFDKLVKDLREYGTKTYTAHARVNTHNSTSAINGVINTLARADRQATVTSRSFVRMGNDSRTAFRGMDNDVRLVVGALPLLLPVAGAAINGTIGLLGALTSAVGVAGAGVAAFGLVAIPTFDKVFEAVGKGRAEVNKLPAGMRQAGIATLRLRTEYEKLVQATQTRVGFTLAAWVDAARAGMRDLAPLINITARSLEGIGRRVEKYFATDTHWRDFRNFVADNINPVLNQMANIVFYGARGVMNLMRAFMPLGQWLLERVAIGMERFATWAERLTTSVAFSEWVERARDSLIAMWNFISSLTGFMFRLADATGSLGNVILRFFTSVFDGLSKLPPEWLAGIMVGLTGIFAALLLGAGGPVALVAGTIMGIVAALAYLNDTNAGVKQSLDGIYQSIRQRFAPIWDIMANNFRTKILPTWERLYQLYRDDLGPVIQDLAQLFVEKVMPRLESIADTLTGRLIPAIGEFLIAVEPLTKWFLETFGELFVDAVDKLAYAFDQALKTISDLFLAFAAAFRGDWDTFWKEMQNAFKDGIIDPAPVLFGEMWNSFLTALREEGELVKEDWNKLWSGLAQASREEWQVQIGDWGVFWETLKNENREEGQIILGDFRTWLDSLSQDFREEMEIWKGLWRGYWGEMSAEWSAFTTNVREIVDQGAEAIGTAWRKIANFFRDPINWVIRVVLNQGVLGSWNTVMGWIGAEQLRVRPVPEIPMFARGGILPGYAPGRDSVLIGAAPGEVMLRPEVGRAVGSGWVNQINAVAMNEGIEGVKRFLAFGGEGLQQFAAGGIVAGQNFARSQVGKPYIWGAVGPGGYDCSGFISAITNAALGMYPHARRFATGSFGAGRGAGGFLPGTNSAFVIGVSPNTGGGIGHMAGNIGGLNVESRGGDGVVVGGAARGPQSSMFPWHFYLPQVGGFFQPAPYSEGGLLNRIVSWWSQIGDRVNGLFDGLLNFSGMPGYGSPIGNSVAEIPRALVGNVKNRLRDRLENVFTMGFDEGGMLPPGYTLAWNGTKKPEPVGHNLGGLSDRDIDRLVDAIRSAPTIGQLNIKTEKGSSAQDIADHVVFEARSARQLGVHH